jgi:hypothetical protein
MRLKSLLTFLFSASLLISTNFGQSKPPVPAQAGTWYQSSSGYTRMELATSSGFKTSGVAKSAFSYGIAKVKGKWLYRNPSATSQLTDHHPVFVLVSVIDVSTQAIALVRLDVKKNEREAQYCEAGAWTGVKEEDKNIVPLTVTRNPDSNNLTITPTADLPDGEYLLITNTGKGYDGYDFGVKQPR